MNDAQTASVGSISGCTDGKCNPRTKLGDECSRHKSRRDDECTVCVSRLAACLISQRFIRRTRQQQQTRYRSGHWPGLQRPLPPWPNILLRDESPSVRGLTPKSWFGLTWCEEAGDTNNNSRTPCRAPERHLDLLRSSDGRVHVVRSSRGKGKTDRPILTAG